MDQEEVLQYAAKLIEQIGPVGEDLFSLGTNYERIAIFAKLRELIHEKDTYGDAVAAEILSWAWESLSK